MEASREDIAQLGRALADIAVKIGSATVEGASEAQQEALAEATAKAAQAALILELAFGNTPRSYGY